MLSGNPVGIDRAMLPRSITEIVHAAASLDFAVPDACMPGVVANLALLDAHVDTLLGVPAGGRR
jgi:sodium/bile acid cotransporter 7